MENVQDKNLYLNLKMKCIRKKSYFTEQNFWGKNVQDKKS